MTDHTLTVGPNGDVVIPASILARYGVTPSTAIQIVESDGAIVLLPASDGSVEPSLEEELRGWQDLYDEAVLQFDYTEQASEDEDR